MPVLFSFRRCPYAITARMALFHADISYRIIDVDLKNKPPSLALLSPKATVPVLYFENNDIILDESKDIASWALSTHLPKGWMDIASLPPLQYRMVHAQIDALYRFFVPQLNILKYSSDISTKTLAFQSQLALFQHWEKTFFRHHNTTLLAKKSLLDLLFLPLIRQWSRIEGLPPLSQYAPNLAQWLAYDLAQPYWDLLMKKPTASDKNASTLLEQQLYNALLLKQ